MIFTYSSIGREAEEFSVVVPFFFKPFKIDSTLKFLANHVYIVGSMHEIKDHCLYLKYFINTIERFEQILNPVHCN